MFSFNKENNVVAVTGGTGFLGKHVCAELKSRGYKNIFIIHTGKDKNKQWMKDNGYYGASVDLRKEASSEYLMNNIAPEAIINLAASVGGIGANQKRSADFMLHTMLIGSNLINSILKYNISYNDKCKLVQVGTVCAYPKFTPVPFKEEDVWNGYPEETNAGYGIAKKTIMELVRQVNLQYPGIFNGVNILPVNLYGPGDSFDLQNSHVIPALIRKFTTAAEQDDNEVVLWGTGEASREFLFVKDAARGIVDAMEKHEGGDFINLGSGKEIKIRELAKLIGSLVGYKGKIVYDTSKPDGQPRRCLNVEKAKKAFGFEATTEFRQGLKETINWYKNEWYTQ